MHIPQDTEKSKILQSIASVIQALPPQEGIAPMEVRERFASHCKVNADNFV